MLTTFVVEDGKKNRSWLFIGCTERLFSSSKSAETELNMAKLPKPEIPFDNIIHNKQI